MRNLTLKQFRTLQAVARHSKIVNAAKELGLTPPAVTIQIKQAEEELGLELFDRSRDGLRLTAAGLAVLEAAGAIENRLRQLREEIDALKGVRAGSLKLGVVSTAKYFAPRMMAAFMQQHPNIKVLLQVGNRAEIVEKLRTHDVDIAIMGRAPQDLPVSVPAYRHVPPRMFVMVTPAKLTVTVGGVVDRSTKTSIARKPVMPVRTPVQLSTLNDVIEPWPFAMPPATLESEQNESPSIVLVVSLAVPPVVLNGSGDVACAAVAPSPSVRTAATTAINARIMRGMNAPLG